MARNFIDLSITRDKDTKEYKVLWKSRPVGSTKKTGKLDEAKTYYTDDAEDAVLTLRATARRALKRGNKVRIVGTSLTKSLISKYSSLSDTVRDCTYLELK